MENTIQNFASKLGGVVFATSPSANPSQTQKKDTKCGTATDLTRWMEKHKEEVANCTYPTIQDSNISSNGSRPFERRFTMDH